MRAIVIGAGPAGASAAIALARNGAEVELIEKSAWPRAKTCGDGVSPLAIRELDKLGATFTHGLQLRRALIATPRGTSFRGGWPAATPWGTIVERRVFDAELVDAAQRAGATFVPATTVRSIVSHETHVDAIVAAEGRERPVRADVAIVAEGATGKLAASLGFPEYRSRVIALRAYAQSQRPLDAEYELFYDRLLSPGYGWIFPLTERRANIGVCVDERTLARAGGDLRAVLRRWLRENPIARETFAADVALEDVRGGVIPSGRASHASGRVFLAGDAAGTADPFTAEGIFEAIHSGALIAQALAGPGSIAAARERYETSLRGLVGNERVARALRATFAVAIEPYARYAAGHARFADRLMTDVFFTKPSWMKLMLHMHLG